MYNLVLIVGRSGSGKSTLISHALQSLQEIQYLQTYTTKPQPTDESRNGNHEYVFVTTQEYEQLRSGSSRWDHSEIHGHYYGVSVDWVRESLKRTHLILAVFPNVDLITSMIAMYQVPTTVIYLDVTGETARKRLAQRDDELREQRAEKEAALLIEPIISIADVVFKPTGVLDVDQRIFCDLVRTQLDVV